MKPVPSQRSWPVWFVLPGSGPRPDAHRRREHELPWPAHRSVTELEDDIRKWVNEWNKDPRPFVWTKSADDILETLADYCQRIVDSGHWQAPGDAEPGARPGRGE